jgi:hypothetical protein
LKKLSWIVGSDPDAEDVLVGLTLGRAVEFWPFTAAEVVADEAATEVLVTEAPLLDGLVI